MIHLNRYILDTCILYTQLPCFLEPSEAKGCGSNKLLDSCYFSYIYIHIQIHILWTVYDLIKYWMISISLHDLLGTPLSQADAVQEKMRAPRGRSASCQPGTLESLKWDMCPLQVSYTFPLSQRVIFSIQPSLWIVGGEDTITLSLTQIFSDRNIPKSQGS